MKRQFASIPGGLLVFLCLSAFAGEVMADACKHAPIEEWPPTEEAWYSAIGTSNVRFREPQGGWILTRAPRWSPDSILFLGPPPDANSAFLVLPSHYAGSETLRVAWSDIERLDRHQGNRIGQGVLFGGLAWLIGGGIIATRHEVPIGFYALGAPVSLVAGGIVGALYSRWDPAYCRPSRPD